MKIAHVVPALTKGGGEKCAAELANHAARVGHEITVIVGWPVNPILLREKLLPDVRVLYVSKKPRSRLELYINLIIWIWKHRKFLEKKDVVHCHLSYGTIFGFLLKKWRSFKLNRVPVIVQTNHSVGAPVSFLRRRLQSFLAKQCDALALIASDEYWSSFAMKHPKILTKIIFNGISQSNCQIINSSKRNTYRRKLGVPSHCKMIVGAIGRMTADREPWSYIPIFKEIAEEFGQDVHFLLAGGGPELKRLQTLVNRQGLEGQVHFPGEINEPTNILSIIDLYVSINVGKITGLAGMEAALFGIPVIARQWIQGYNPAQEDWIWSSTNQSEVAKKACELLKSTKRRELLSRKQKTYVQAHHTIETMANSYYDMYKAAIDDCQSLNKSVS